MNVIPGPKNVASLTNNFIKSIKEFPVIRRYRYSNPRPWNETLSNALEYLEKKKM